MIFRALSRLLAPLHRLADWAMEPKRDVVRLDVAMRGGPYREQEATALRPIPRLDRPPPTSIPGPGRKVLG